MNKELTDPEKTQVSLRNLRDEFVGMLDAYEYISLAEVVFKINSCLFSEYPHQRKDDNA